MNLYRYQDHNLWEQINRANKKEIAAGIYQKIFFYSFVSGISGKQNGLYHFIVD